MSKKDLLIIFFIFLFNFISHSQIKLSYNVGSTPINTNFPNCEYDEIWARAFTLSDFGISKTEQFIIKSGQVAISNAYKGAKIGFSISIIDNKFPNSTPEVISYNDYIEVSSIGEKPEIVNIVFSSPIVVPSTAERILVTVSQLEDLYNPNYKKVNIAGTEQDNDVSWFSGCRKYYKYISTKDLIPSFPDANFFINVTGEKLSIINTNSKNYLSQSSSDNVIQTNMFSCTSAHQYWARKYILSDFNIGKNEEFIIDKGFVGLSGAEWQSSVQFNIYKIDKNFPSSFSESDLIGSSQSVEVPYFSYTSVGNRARIFMVDFETPIIIPADVETILVEVKKGVVYGGAEVFIAGTLKDNDDSWYRGGGSCGPNIYVTTKNMFLPKPNANFYITVSGNSKEKTPFEIQTRNGCVNTPINFSVTNNKKITSLAWSFDDSISKTNTSTEASTSHTFSLPGTYDIMLEVSHINGTVYSLTKKIKIFDFPNSLQTVTLKQCDNNNDGFSFFNLKEVNEKIIRNSSNYSITYFETKSQAENNSNKITNVTAYKNKSVSLDKVWARVENKNGCFSVSEINLIVSTTQIPLSFTRDFYTCDDGSDTRDGIATFNFKSVIDEVKNVFPSNQQLIIRFYESEEDALKEINAIPDATINSYQNSTPHTQNIYVRVDSALNNDCLGLGKHITLHVEDQPIANKVIINPECDNDRDGFFEFDTSKITSTLIGNQTNVIVKYFDKDGKSLPSPLPNPFITKSQIITAKVFNNSGTRKCYDETSISFIVNPLPTVNRINAQEKCDDDYDGVSSFDTSAIEKSILGTQKGMTVKYFDEEGKELASPLPNPFRTSSQIITARIENSKHIGCYVETSIKFLVREKPKVTLDSEAVICTNNSPLLTISVVNPNPNFTYTWTDENRNLIGTGVNINVTKGGKYLVTATSPFSCSSDTEQINVIESQKPAFSLENIKIIDDSEINSIIIKSSNLDLEKYKYRLLSLNGEIVKDYQENPSFMNIDAGIYLVEIINKNGCGIIRLEFSLINFPKFFTPNNDGVNDVWEIKGFSSDFYPTSDIYIYNRHGKIIANLPANRPIWNGTYKGGKAPTNDYWFSVQLTDKNGNTRIKKGNFSLLRK